MLFTQLSVNVVQATRIRAEIATEQARRQAEIAAEQVRRQAALDAERAVQEAERAVQAFRAALARAECAVSEAGARALHAAGIALGDLYEMDAATAQRRAGLSAEDAQLVAALEKREFDCPYPGAPFGEGGVLHRIGTDHGRRAWVNPHTDGRVVAAMSSVSYGAPHKFVGRSDDGDCFTGNTPNSWMSVDLGAERTVVPTHYCLRNDDDGDCSARNWALEGKAADEGDWQEIKRHDNDATLARQDYAVGAWPVDAGGRAFRHLRIRQHGKNAYGSDKLGICGFEVYARLLDAEA